MLTEGAAAAALRRLREAQARDGSPSLERRREALLSLRRLVTAEAEGFAAAISEDFGGRSWHETMISEVGVVVAAIDHALARLHRWSRPERVFVGWRFWPARALVLKQPLGIVGVIAPWNYPVQLALSPLVGALAAGCRVVLKPSEHTPRTAEAICAAVARHLDRDLVAAVAGGPELAAEMSGLAFDKLLFTGSSATGRRVLRAAADTLTPVVLELGGKSPAIIDPSADLKRAAADIVAGKLLNAGQTCVAPDYVLLPRATMPAFVEAAKAAAARMRPDPSGSDATAVCRSADRERLKRLVAGLDLVPLLPTAEPRGTSPCLVIDPPQDGELMSEEIFGPVLPLVPYDDPEEVFDHLNLRPAPLALYWFGRDRSRLTTVLARTRSGGVAVNDTVLQVAVEGLPFGGLGESGVGAYHGRAGFDAFTHRRSVFLQSPLSGARLLRPPYGRLAERAISAMVGGRVR
ncbi:aldehyde dehydrogenase family protein [Caulobacter sp. S45]|uniref:aldehyde dehydrogenase family protein n=1 Tax=Caulobacter sp. S45 TaxID=1641861 RepID=UPI0015756606|nr:aldehyde dehydrogenase family protein [Caulobacter sp. S45]